MTTRANEFKLNIGEIVLQFKAEDGVQLELGEPHRWFAVDEGNPDLTLRVHRDTWPRLGMEEKLFESGGIWDLYRTGDKYELTLSAPPAGPLPYRAAIINQEFTSGDLYTRVFSIDSEEDTDAKSDNGFRVINPTGYPLDEVLIMTLLSRGRGVELHGCGIVENGRGILFIGVSGAGKSTLANLWKKRPGVSILSDDRLILRRIDGRFQMFGTPWHGDAKTSQAGSAPLEKVFLIKQSPNNYAKPLTPIDAASRLMVRCFPPYWDSACLDYTLRVLDEIANEVPCYELGFLPDDSILEFIDNMDRQVVAT